MSPVEDIANLIWALTRLENPGDSRLAMLEKLCGLAQKQIWHLEPQAPMLTDADRCSGFDLELDPFCSKSAK